MAEYSEKGLTLRWDAPDLVSSERPPPGPLIVIAARPAHPSNVVTALYTVDGGAARIARGYRLRAVPRADGEELFALDLPPQAYGARVAFVPILSCSGRQADPRRGRIRPNAVSPAASAAGHTWSDRRWGIERRSCGPVAPSALCFRAGVPLSGHRARGLRHRSGRRDARRPPHEVPPPERGLRSWPCYNG